MAMPAKSTVEEIRERFDKDVERFANLETGQSATIASDTQVRAFERNEVEDRIVVRELTHRVAEVAERVRERMDRLGELDAASQDVVIEVVRALEEQLWMIRAQFSEPRER